jgi:hypothetical protein
LLGRLGLLSSDGLPGWKAALVLAALAFGLPAVLALLQSLVDPAYSPEGLFEDSRTWVRWLVAVVLVTLAEQTTDTHFNKMIDRFRGFRVAEGPAAPGFEAALEKADRRTSSAVAEALMLLVVLGLSAGTIEYRWVEVGSSWAGVIRGDALTLSWAGQAVTWISDPLFAFLLLRWLWRFAVLARMMFDISRLPLKLRPLHPDRVGGLSFLAEFPQAFSGLIFALSCVLASGIYEHRAEEMFGREVMQLASVCWVALLAAITLGPLAFFSRTLRLARDRAREEYGVLLVGHLDAFHDKWVGRNPSAKGSPLDDESVSSLSDLDAVVEPLIGMNVLPGGLAGLRSIGIAAAAPLLIVMALNLSLDEVFELVSGLFF